jgi:hypothetical protein
VFSWLGSDPDRPADRAFDWLERSSDRLGRRHSCSATSVRVNPLLSLIIVEFSSGKEVGEFCLQNFVLVFKGINLLHEGFLSLSHDFL